MYQPEPSNPSATPISVERWPTEFPLLALIILAATGVWIILLLSLIGFAYALFIGIFLFLSHLGFIAHLRGSAVRLSPEQFPDLYRRVTELAVRAGLKETPEVYIMQAGGVLNALATRFLRSQMVVLFSDLLDACGDNTAARDMIIGHELGHIKAGHLRWMWFLFPGYVVPFLGMAYSRAREYTCDRYGAALCGDREGALVGLGILAAGGSHGPQVNLTALARQQEQLDTGWMTIGTWLSTHPPLSHRIVALQPSLVEGTPSLVKGPLRALVILSLVAVVFILGTAFGVKSLLPGFQQAFEQASTLQQSAGVSPLPEEQVEPARQAVQEDFRRLVEFIEKHRAETGSLPADANALYQLWTQSYPEQTGLFDPFDGRRYGYFVEEGVYYLWSSGPDAQDQTDDDIWYNSETQREGDD
jgi:Zn-dependent protease with chaperone function